MKKIILISISILAFAILIGAEYYAQSDRFSRRLKPLVSDLLKSVLGNDVQVGSVRANFIPIYIEARDVSITDGSREELAAIRKIKVYINPVSLLLNKINMPSIVFLEPRIAIKRTRDGAFNYTAILERIRQNIGHTPSQSRSRFTIVLGTIAVNQGTILFNDELTATRASLSEIQINTKVSLASDSARVMVKNCKIRAAAPAYNELAGALKAVIRYEHGRYRIESSELTSSDTTLSAAGDLGRLPDVALNLKVKMRSGLQTIGKFTDVFKAFKKKEHSPHIEAEATIKGNITSPAVVGTFRLDGIAYEGMVLQDASAEFNYGDNSLNLIGRNWKVGRGKKDVVIENFDATFDYREQGFDIRRFYVLAGDLAVSISGRADPQRGFDAQLQIESTDRSRTLSFLTSFPVDGRIAVSGTLSGAFTAPAFEGKLTAGPTTIRGILFNRAEGRVRFNDRKLTLASVDIRQQESQYVFDGSADISGSETVFSARLKVLHSDVVSVVALFYKPIPLILSARGELSFDGTVTDFTGNGHLELESGSAYGESFTHATVKANLSRDKIEFPQVHVVKGGGTVNGTGWIAFNGSYSARIEGHGVKLSEVDYLPDLPVDGDCRLEIESGGPFSKPRVSASLSMDELMYDDTSVGRLTAGMEISDRVLTIQSSIAGGRAGVSARMALSKPYAWSVQAKVDADGVDPFLLIGEKEFFGRVRLSANGSMNLRGSGTDASTFSGAALFSRLTILLGEYRIENSEEINASMQAGKIAVSSLTLTGPGTMVGLTGGAGLMKDADLLFTGSVNLSILRLLFHEIEHADGIAEVKLTVRDEWKNPEVTGEMVVRNGEVKIKDFPQKLSALKGKFVFDRSRLIVESLNGEFGGGTVNASGWAQLSGFALTDFSTTAAFENVTVRYPEGLTSTLSGNLYYDGDLSEQSLTGDLLIRRARYDKRVEWKSMLVDVGRGLYQKKKAEAGRIGDTHVNIRFHGEEDILFQNNLAKMPLDVDVFLRGTLNQPQLLGRVAAAKGSVYFRKNEFRIIHASADFVDPSRINPVLDIQAEIRVRDVEREYRIGLAVSGTADRAVVTLVSDPSLRDSDILALLALGKTGTELRAAGREAGVGMNEAAYLATGQFQDIFESRARSLTGLDRFQVDPYITKSDTSVPRVTVGKEIVQDKLYVTYSSNVGSTTQEQVFRIEYILDRHFSLVGERNELGNTGADIKYRFEFK